MKRSVSHFETEIEEISYEDGSKVSERREHTKADGFPAVLCALRSRSVLGTLVSFITGIPGLIKRKLLKHNYYALWILKTAVYMA